MRPVIVLLELVFYLSLVLLAFCLSVALVAHAQDAVVTVGDFNRGHAFARGLDTYLTVLPHLAGGSTWYSPLQRNHGTLVASPVWKSSSVSGWYGEVQFVGASNQYLTFGATGHYDFADTTFTISVQLTRASNPGAEVYLVGYRNASGSPAGGYLVRIMTAGTLAANIRDGSDVKIAERVSTSSVLYDGGRHTVTVVFTTNTTTAASNDVAIYLDGKLDQGARTGTSSNGYTPCPSCAFNIGASADLSAGQFLNGSLNNLQIYSRGLSAAEVATLAQTPGPLYGGLFHAYETAMQPVLFPARQQPNDP
jgi:Concanavalin A-like lectin/glucanases superfamily